MGGTHESGTPIYDLANHAWGYHEDSKKDATFLLAFILLIVVSLALSWVLAHRWKCKVLPEACVVLTVGMVAGFLCKELFVKRGKRGFFSGALLGFDNALFFLGLLPPVIFYSGYELHPQWLFGLFYQIVGFAVVGTFVSAVIVGIVLKIASVCHLAPLDITFAETLTFGALVSATDPVSVIAVFTELRVDPKMFYLVFGESVLNDAVGIGVNLCFNLGCLGVACTSRGSCPSLGRSEGRGAEIARRGRSHSARSEERLHEDGVEGSTTLSDAIDAMMTRLTGRCPHRLVLCSSRPSRSSSGTLLRPRISRWPSPILLSSFRGVRSSVACVPRSRH